MTAIGKQVDPLARKLAPVVREMLMAEVERIAASIPSSRAKAGEVDADIMKACRVVASAADRLAQAKYGPGEIAARKSLENAANGLRRAMCRHGRMP
ncbi:hypothetical protein [Mesorhizobium sp. B2-5-3]|uniref:hypothetical protein n=1 Tax=Mesorhizobium sp. B2-5-3 TaxID=2589927 RepID=UPI00112DE752|nr:hypothetical protein [Mesorhizobium sp. B2-5-3]TPK38685.1 hypothetical protein FJ867_08755 [Mesorhizobium sp. B2-5-3]